jgi:hypothetical protein
LPRVKLARRTKLEGRPLVVFRVEVADGRRMQVSGIQMRKGYRGESYSGATSSADPIAWSSSQVWPIEKTFNHGHEFGVYPPAGVAIWKLDVTVDTESPKWSVRYQNMARVWKGLRKGGVNAYDSMRVVWNTFYTELRHQVETEPVTSTGPDEGEKKDATLM